MTAAATKNTSSVRHTTLALLAALATVVGIAVLALGVASARADTLAPGFSEAPVLTGLDHPTVVRFAPNGDPRVFVGEKSGRVYVFPSLSSNTPTLVADLSNEVHDYWDRGLLGLAVDPGFPAAGHDYIYVLYTYDAPPGGSAPTWGDTCPTPPGPTTDGCVVQGRLSRLTIDPATNKMIGSEQVLITDWCQQSPTHSIGDLMFGPDGALYASGGSGASFTYTDYGQGGGTLAGTPTPANPCGDPPVPVGGSQTPPTAEGGSLRSQSFRRPSSQPATLDGTVIRVDPATGDPHPGNPNVTAAGIDRQRIVTYGLRQPFRFTFRPGTNELWIGDVGENTWEEINRDPNPLGAPTVNFGWPCYEGPAVMPDYQAAGLNLCQSLYNDGTATGPYYTYNHANHVAANDNCPTSNGSSITGLAFVPADSPYPSSYHGALIFGDHTRNCVWVMMPGSNGLPDPGNIQPFISGAGHPVDLEIGPDGNLYYVDLEDGAIVRVRYQSPNAIATASPTDGPAPLSVSFGGDQSTAGNGAHGPGALSYQWEFGDGGSSTSADPTHAYTVKGTYSARLTVTDIATGETATSAPITITAGASPPTATISSPAASLAYAVGDAIQFSGSARDSAGHPLTAASDFSWTLIIHHCPSVGNCHTHEVQTFSGPSGKLIAPDHGYPSYLELQLTVTDPASGLTDTKSVSLQPRAVQIALRSNPSGVPIGFDLYDPTTPATETVIVGSQNSISAPSPFAALGGPYTFGSWSDGGAASHLFTASANMTLTANYVGPGGIGGGGGGGGLGVVPRLTGTGIAPGSFRVGPRRPTPRLGRPFGAQIRYTLSQDATLVMSFQRGVRVGRHWSYRSISGHVAVLCRRVLIRAHGVRSSALRCPRRVSDQIVFVGLLGTHVYRFSGWVGGAALAPGRYRLTLRAIGPGLAASAPQTLTFVVRA